MRLDELNVLRSEIKDVAIKKRIRDYFDGMELLLAMIEERIDIAYKFYQLVYSVFNEIGKLYQNNKAPEKSKLYDKYFDRFKQIYIDTMRNNGISGNTIDELENHIDLVVGEIVQNTLDKLEAEQDSKADSTKSAEEKEKIAKKAEDVLSQDRAVEIAIEETKVAKAADDYFKAILDGKTKKTWVTMKDELVRKTHVPMDEVTVGIFELFNVNGSLMRYPGDTDYGADPHEIIRCRCIADYN